MNLPIMFSCLERNIDRKAFVEIVGFPNGDFLFPGGYFFFPNETERKNDPVMFKCNLKLDGDFLMQLLASPPTHA